MRDQREPIPGSDPEADGGDGSVYETVFREMEDAVFLVDVEEAGGEYAFRFRRTNTSHQRLTGISLEEIAARRRGNCWATSGGRRSRSTTGAASRAAKPSNTRSRSCYPKDGTSGRRD